jgi:hypothetical protein
MRDMKKEHTTNALSRRFERLVGRLVAISKADVEKLAKQQATAEFKSKVTSKRMSKIVSV